MPIMAGLSGEVTHRVTDADTAMVIGSGDVPVLATPRLLALAEAATCAVLEPHLDSGATSLGTRVELEHLLATAVGAQVTVTATVEHVDGRLVRFEVSATDDQGRLVAHGRVTRVIVDRERFLSRL